MSTRKLVILFVCMRECLNVCLCLYIYKDFRSGCDFLLACFIYKNKMYPFSQNFNYFSYA